MVRRADDIQLQKVMPAGRVNENAEALVDELFNSHDFFDPLDPAQVKYEMLRCVANGLSVTEAVRAFGFSSHHSFYKARDAFRRNGLAGLVPIRRPVKKNGSQARQESKIPLVGNFISDELEIDFVMRTARVRHKKIRLTPIQLDLLRYLVAQRGRPVPHREILSAVWGPQFAEKVEYLRVYITSLRKKIEPDPAKPRYILTEPWVGYRFMGSGE